VNKDVSRVIFSLSVNYGTLVCPEDAYWEEDEDRCICVDP